MCGLAGFAGAGDRADLARMSSAVAHRGPDGCGEYVDEAARVFLAHRRLAIIDLGGGAQPMWDAKGEIGVVFNGEIYNHLELRRELEALGHRFRTDHSDTEVLVHGYRAWGEGLPARLNGMFAFVAYDRPRRRLFAARDRFGKKPFYYSHGAGGLAFASELSALLAHARVPRQLDSHALQKYFAWGYLPAPLTPYARVAKLPGGHLLVFDCDDASLRVRPYWRFAIEPLEPKADEAALAEELRARLAVAVRRRLISDVPLGVFLSGGIDSSAVLAYAAGSAGKDLVETFSIGFEEPSFDESRYARLAASAFRSRHHERVLTMEQARAGASRLLEQMDEPTGDVSILPTHLLSAFTRESVSVALGGDGGDELFAGYAPFHALGPARRYRQWVPPMLHRLLRGAVERLPVRHGYMSLGFRLRRALRGVEWPPSMWNPVWMAPASPQEIGRLFETPLPAEALYAEAIAAWESAPFLDEFVRSLFL